jgi:hypothetical protein
MFHDEEPARAYLSIVKEVGGSTKSHTPATHASFCGGRSAPQRSEPCTDGAASSASVTTLLGGTAPVGSTSRTFWEVPLYLLIRKAYHTAPTRH